jgi:hypothetical protein
MKRILPLALVTTFAALLASCRTPEPAVERHYYHTNTVTRTVKPAPKPPSTAPEDFQAVTPPASYSR